MSQSTYEFLTHWRLLRCFECSDINWHPLEALPPSLQISFLMSHLDLHVYSAEVRLSSKEMERLGPVSEKCDLKDIHVGPSIKGREWVPKLLQTALEDDGSHTCRNLSGSDPNITSGSFQALRTAMALTTIIVANLNWISHVYNVNTRLSSSWLAYWTKWLCWPL